MILKRYINHEILRTCGAILIVLILIFISTRFIRYIQLAVDGNISSSAVFSLLGLQIPAVAGFLIPLSFFIAILLTFGRLYSENEMVVMQCSGVSEWQLARYIFPLALFLSVIAGVLSFVVTPWASLQTKNLMAQEKAEAKFGIFSPGRFHENASKTGVVFAEFKNLDDTIKGIFAVSGLKKDSKNTQIQIAKSAQLHEKQKATSVDNRQMDKNYLMMEDGATYVFDHQLKRWQITEYSNYFMQIDEPTAAPVAFKKKSISTIELLNRLQIADWAELHWRLSAPFSIIILCFLAIPLARTEPRKGKFSRLFPAIMIYLVYALLMMNGRRFIETEKVPVELGFWWIHGIAAVFSLWLFRGSFKNKKRLLGKGDNELT